jgi:hypothetical protein
MRRWLAESAAQRKKAGLRLWIEAVLVAVVYLAYSAVRNLFGSAAVSPDAAAANADRVISIEESLGLYIEADVQEAFIDYTAFIQFWNLFYGLFHFAVTFGALIWLFVRFPADYRFWRRAGLIATSSALVGYAVFPLMPPRLLGNCGPYGACRAGERFVDTVVEVGGIWSFESSGLEAISNQYAAMPSLHIGWALWSALILGPRLKHKLAQLLAWVYPLLTLFAIVVTANHYWIDGLGGVAVVAIGFVLSKAYDQWANGTKFTSNPTPSDSGSGDLASTVGRGVA